MPTQSTSVIGNPNGINYSVNGETWTILAGVVVEGTIAGVGSTFIDSTLDNSGTVLGGQAGVFFEPGDVASDYVVTNRKPGVIEGGYAGVVMSEFLGDAVIDNKGSISGVVLGLYLSGFSGSADIFNKGSIDGGQYGAALFGAAVVDLVNKGTISGDVAGIFSVFSEAQAGSSITNSGTIESPEIAMVFDSDTGTRVDIRNEKGGLIDGSVLAILSAEKTALRNDGKVIGDIVTAAFEDSIVNKGKLLGDTYLGSGDDVFRFKGKGKAGLIDLGDGNDLFVLGRKADKLLFQTDLDAAGNVDTIRKFASGKDLFHLDDDIFAGIAPGTLSSAAFRKGTAAVDADDRIIYDKASGALYYDADGLGGVAQTQFAQLDGGPKLKASDFTIGEYSLIEL